MFDIYDSKALKIIISDKIIGNRMIQNELIMEPKEEKVCNCEEPFIIYNKREGERVCALCGEVIESKIVSTSPSPVYDDGRIKEQNERMCNTFNTHSFKRSEITTFQKRVNLNRVLSRNNYFSSKERRDITISSMIKQIGDLCKFNKKIIDHAYDYHFRRLSAFDILRGHDSIEVCAAILHISAIEMGYPVQLQYITSCVKKIKPDLKKNAIFKMREKFNEIGYKFRTKPLAPKEVVSYIAKSIREAETGLPESDIMHLEITASECVEKYKFEIQSIGNISSFVPSIFYYIAQRKKIPLSTNQLEEFVYLSKSTIIQKYKKLVKIFKIEK